MIDEKKLIKELIEKNHSIVFRVENQLLLNKVIRIIEEQPTIEYADIYKHRCLNECTVKNNIIDIYNYIINPPLRLEELKVGMIVWDKIIRMYMEVIKKHENKLVIMEPISNNSFEFIFEENRFYRKQVEDND